MPAAWRAEILPWFERIAAQAWRSSEKTAVVLPHRSLAVHFRAQLLAAEIPLLGVNFFSPGSLREYLLQSLPVRVPLREDSELLLAIAAAECAGRRDEESASAADAVKRAPEHLLRALDQLGAAGWALASDAPTELRQIVDRFEELNARCGFTIGAGASQLASNGETLFGNLLIAGFDGAHWPHWPMLFSAVNGAARATVILTEPRAEAHDLDATWIGSWEQEFGEAIPCEADDALPVSLASVGNPETHFLVGRTTTEQAAAITALATSFLADPRCRRIGIVFPEAGALPRMVSADLAERGIPHHDAIAHLAPGPFEDRAWFAWLELQTSQRLHTAMAFLRLQPKAMAAFAGLTSDRVANLLERVLDDLLIDDLAVLEKFCRARPDKPESLAVANGLSALRILPATATLPEFLGKACAIFEELGWRERRVEIQRRSGGWAEALEPVFDRAIFLRWLAAVTSTFASIRDEAGSHPYSRLQLLLAPQGADQDWSHLILCGLNEGTWSSRAASVSYLGDEEVAALNARARVLNQRALRQGNQGEGHAAVQPGKSLCLGATEQREILARYFSALLESADIAVAVCATLFDESAPGRIANPSEFFTRLYHSARKGALSETTFRALAEQTASWLNEHPAGPAGAVADVAQTRRAYEQRRAPAPAGEFEFALRAPLDRRVVLAVTSWEFAMKAPALVWLRNFLGVEPQDRTEQTPAATGKWVHRWLAAIGDRERPNEFTSAAPPAELRQNVSDEARKFREGTSALLRECGRALPDWWMSSWTNAAYLADCLAAKLADANAWPQLATEWRLHETQITLRTGATLSFSGRADLVLARGGTDAASLADRDLWVIDYKTGEKKTLRPSRCESDAELSEKLGKKLRAGEAIQLSLYALAFRAAGARRVAVSLLPPNLSLDGPQLNEAEIVAQDSFWNEFARMQATGIFGMRGAIRSEFSFSGDYPLATLAIDQETLETKWTLTHPAFAIGTREEE